MSRKKSQAEAIFRAGQWFGPVLKMCERPTVFDNDERVRILARFFAERETFTHGVWHFFNGERGHSYDMHRRTFDQVVSKLVNRIGKGMAREEMAKAVATTSDAVIDIILSVPTPVDSAIYEAQTPFTTYCFVKDLCSTVKSKIVWLDRYFDQSIFHRFFTETPRDTNITLVTYPATKATGGKDKQRVNEFRDISKLFAAERGPQGYRLVESDSFHDRWLQCDTKLFVLGGSIKDLTATFTISRLDGTPENEKHFDDVIANGVEVFGPKVPVHP